MSAYAEGNRVRVVNADGAAGLYEDGSTGTVVAVKNGHLTVQWDHNDKSSLVFEREVKPLFEHAEDEGDPGANEPTLWDQYAMAALQALVTGRSGGPILPVVEAAATIATLMMQARRGKTGQ